MEVEDWQDPRSSPPSAEDEEDEVVTFNIGGQHIPASFVTRPGMPNKENETGVMCGTPDKMGSVPGATFDAPAPPTGSSLPRTPQQEPACRTEAACHVPSSPALPAASAELNRTPLGPSKSAGLHNQAPSPLQAGMGSPVPGAAANVAAEERTPGASRRLSSGMSSATKSPLPTAAAALPPSVSDTSANDTSVGDRLGSPQAKIAQGPAPVRMASPQAAPVVEKVEERAAAPATPTAVQPPVPPSTQPAKVSSSGGVKNIVTAIEARTTQLLQTQMAARRNSRENLPGSLDAEATQAEEESEESTEGAARRLSAGLSLRYESSGEHCPKYSQRELDIILNKRLDDLRITYEAKLRATTEQCMDAQTRADAAIQAHMQYQVEINQQLETTWADYERRAQEAEGKLAAKDWQLNAVTQQAQDLCSKVAQLETDLGDCRKKIDEAAGVEERLSTEWNAKLEAEKIRRRKDVQEMKELVSSRAKEQFAKAQEQYKQLGAAYGETKEELSKLANLYNTQEQALATAAAAREQALGAVSGLEQEVASLKSALAAKDLDVARISKEMEARGEESRLLLEKEIYARDNAIRDREQALDSLSRTAITLQDYKRRFEELQVVHDRTLAELAETKAMAEELLSMLETKEGQQAAVEQKE